MAEYTVEVAGRTLEVTARVTRCGGGSDIEWHATLSSVRENGAEIPDEIFEPIATEIETAVIDAHCERRFDGEVAA